MTVFESELFSFLNVTMKFVKTSEIFFLICVNSVKVCTEIFNSLKDDFNSVKVDTEIFNSVFNSKKPYRTRLELIVDSSDTIRMI